MKNKDGNKEHGSPEKGSSKKNAGRDKEDEQQRSLDADNHGESGIHGGEVIFEARRETDPDTEEENPRGGRGDKDMSTEKKSALSKISQREKPRPTVIPESRLTNELTTKSSPTERKSSVATDVTRKKKTVALEQGNSLSKLIPGYTAPPTLTSQSLLARYRPVSSRGGAGIEDLRRKALSEQSGVKAAAAAAKKMLQSNAPVASFKMAHRKNRQRGPPGDAGDGWFGMKPTPMTEDVKRDLRLIRNRNYLDPKRFYKSADPIEKKVVQIGTVVEGAAEYYSSRLTKKQRRTNLVDEVLADPATASYAQNKYRDMQREKTAAAMKRKKYKGGSGKKR